MRRLFILGAYLSFIFLLSCGSNETGEDIDRNIESQITISRGVYGQTTSYDDSGANKPEYFEDFSIMVYDSIPENSSIPVAQTLSQDRGFYEIELAKGVYYLCTSYLRCTKINIETSFMLRCDFEFSIAFGWDCGEPLLE